MGYEMYFYAGGILALSLLSTILIVSLRIAKNKNKELENRLSNREEIANESYVKFLDQSRETAYEYIEDVQDKLAKFSNIVEPQLSYFNTYGRLVQSPHIIMLDRISEAYDELKTVLPQENKEK